jgi:hypothetical protein
MVMVCHTKGLETQTRLEPFLSPLGDMVVPQWWWWYPVAVIIVLVSGMW